MNYNCQTVPLSKLSDSRMKTMCDNCKSMDCENPIENRIVSIIGVSKKMRLYVTKTSDSVVTQCDGFIT